MYVDVEHPQLGKVTITNQGIKMTKTNPYVRGCAPMLGQHNYEVLGELGYTSEEIAFMKQNGEI